VVTAALGVSDGRRRSDIMKKPDIVVIDRDLQNGQQFCTLLKKLNYSAVLISVWEDLEKKLAQGFQTAVILDLDSVAVPSAGVRALRKKFPRLHILGVSRRSLHPGMEELIRSHIYACLRKPVDEDELLFWLKSIADNLAQPEAPSEI